MNTLKNRLIISTSWRIYLLMVGLPLFIVVLDYISTLMTHTAFGLGIINVAIVILLSMFILVPRLLIISRGRIKLWPGLIFGEGLYIDKISQIDVKVGNRLFFNTGRITPTLTMYFMDSNLKVLNKINLATFDKNSLALFIQKIILINPKIKLNDKAKDLSVGDDTLVQREIRNSYVSLMKAWIMIFVISFAIIVIFYLLN